MKTLLAKLIVFFADYPTDPEIRKAIKYKKVRPWSSRIPFWKEQNRDLIEAYEKYKDNLHVIAAPWGG